MHINKLVPSNVSIAARPEIAEIIKEILSFTFFIITNEFKNVNAQVYT